MNWLVLLFDKILIRILKKPVFTGSYDGQWEFGKGMPPNPIMMYECPVHGFYRNIIEPIKVKRKIFFIVKCVQCEFKVNYNPKGRKWI